MFCIVYFLSKISNRLSKTSQQNFNYDFSFFNLKHFIKIKAVIFIKIVVL